ncbi:hypothetical protein A9498_31550 (plasmid) [Bacillus thuringiensis serovar coreanensis]|nr:hypothetical protein A9498_31550 [Bacillus thuringiensis serovar coreanensis]
MSTEQSNSISSAESAVRPRHFHYAYAHDEYIDYVNPNWMAHISDNTRFNELSIPGTHDTMALYGGDNAQCQTMSLTTQLNAGIRYLDIRCRHMDNIFYIYHGIVYQRARFEDVCNDVSAFLRTNPRETIFMRIKEESTPSNNTRSFAETFAVYKSQYSNLFWNFTDYTPRLGDIRGKVVVLQNFSSDYDFGIPYGSLDIQDHYHLTTNWDLYDKWLYVKEFLYEADYIYKTGYYSRVYLNYLSGSGGPFPYFVASGHSSPQTSAPRLSTGLTTPAFEDWYPDFPRINCAGNVCTIAFEGTNILTSDWIQNSNFEYVGILAADFPGGGLISNTIQINGGRVIQDGIYQIVTTLNNSSVVDMDPSTKNVHLWQNNYASNQKWRFVYDPHRKAYQIRSVANGDLVLAWNDFDGSNNVFATLDQDYDEHYWFVIHAGNGYFYLQNKKNPTKVLDVADSGTSNGTNIIVWNYNGGTNQKFRLERV